MLDCVSVVSTAQAVMAKDAHHAAELTHWTLLRKVEISLFMLVTILAAAAVTFCDSVLAPFLQVHSLSRFLIQELRETCEAQYMLFSR